MSRFWASLAINFCGRSSVELYSSSSKFGWFESVIFPILCDLSAYRDRQVIAAGELGNFTFVSEAGPHDNCLIAIFLVVVENGLYALDAWVVLGGIIFFRGCLVPIQDSANERRDKECTSFGCSNCLWEGEHQSQVAVDAMLSLQSVCGLDAFPCRCELDEDSRLVNANRFVQLYFFSV